MPGENLIELEGRVIEALPGGVLRVELSNGHCLIGYLSRALREAGRRPAADERVVLKVSPGDFSQGRVIEIKRT